MPLDFRSLQAFLTVCEEGNISRAAQALYLSQPALTRRMQELESHYGAALFRRSKKGVTLTEAGYHLQVRAKEMLALADRTEREMEENAGRLGGIVRLGVVETKAAPLAARWLRDWCADRPKAQFELYAADGDDVRRLLDEDRLDIAVLLEPVETAKYESIALPCWERWGVVVRADDPLLTEPVLTMETLRRMKLILPRRHIVRQTLQAWFGETAERLSIAGYHNLPTNALELVRAGLGALLCVEGSYAMRPSDDLRFVALYPERRTAHRLAKRRHHQLSRAAEDFWQMCLEHARNENGADASGSGSGAEET